MNVDKFTLQILEIHFGEDIWLDFKLLNVKKKKLLFWLKVRFSCEFLTFFLLLKLIFHFEKVFIQIYIWNLFLNSINLFHSPQRRFEQNLPELL